MSKRINLDGLVEPTTRDELRAWNDTLRAIIATQAAEIERLRAAILDIDAHATPFGIREEDPEGNPTFYAVTVGALHRALGVVGHSAAKCDECPHPAPRSGGNASSGGEPDDIRRHSHDCLCSERGRPGHARNPDYRSPRSGGNAG